MNINDFAAMRQAVRNEANAHRLDAVYWQQCNQLERLLTAMMEHRQTSPTQDGTPRQWNREGTDRRVAA